MEELLALAEQMSAEAARDAVGLAAQRVVHGSGFSAAADPRARARALLESGGAPSTARAAPHRPDSPFALLCRAVERRAALDDAAREAAIRGRRR